MPARKKRKPNVVFILADDMGYGDVRHLSPECRFPTPNLDTIGREGVSFTDAHSSSSVCTPSRYSILTGRYCWRTFLKKGVLVGTDDTIIDKDRKLVSQVFKEKGYDTACVGKWHLGWEWQPKEGCKPKLFGVNIDLEKETAEWVDYSKPIKNGPTDFGFDYFYGISGSLDMPPYVYVENDKAVKEPAYWGSVKEFHREGVRQLDLRANNVLGTLTDKAVDFIDSRGYENPFFLYFPITAPHTPIAPSPEFDGKSGINPYADFCMEVDFRVGQVLEALKRKGFDRNTIVVFTTDNGTAASSAECEFLEERYGHYCTHIYRGYKSDIWDGGHRLPFLVRWPEKMKGGEFCNEPIGLFDFFATVCDLVEYEKQDNEGEDSVSFLPALLGKDIDNDGREAIIHHSMLGKFAVRMGEWKLCYCPGSGGWSSPKDKEAEEQGLPEYQLYNMRFDPTERENLYGKKPLVEKKMLDLVQKYINDGRSTNGAKQNNDPVLKNEEWNQLSFLPEMPERFVIDD